MRVRKEVQGVIFRKGNDEKEFLLVKKLGPKSREYRWRLLKGGVETGETERQALEREIFEEVGLRRIKVLEKTYDYGFTFGNIRHMVSSYPVEADPSENISLGPAEVVDYIWVSRQRVMEMLYWKDEKQAINLLG
jgi:8-oxo-dGTP pyrophosphatase MutT (NUDIX family)